MLGRWFQKAGDEAIQVGRDNYGGVTTNKTIQYITVLGGFLESAQIEGLLPRVQEAEEFPNIPAALEKVFNQKLGNDITQATVTAGVILQAVFSKFPLKADAGLPYIDILAELSRVLPAKLRELHYWDGFHTSISLSAGKFLGKFSCGDGIWFDSLQLLWEKHFSKARRYGIATFYVDVDKCPKSYEGAETITREDGSKFYSRVPCFVVSDKEEGTCEAQNPFYPTVGGEISQFTPKQFRVFMVGLIVDIIRIVSESSINVEFWKCLVDNLSTKPRSK